VISHESSVSFYPELSNLVDTCPAIRAKDNAEKLRQEVVELLAVVGVGELGAISTGNEFVLDATRSDLAPLGLLVVVTSWAFAFSIRPAGATVETTVSDQIWV
jgi:hypothetical protein